MSDPDTSRKKSFRWKIFWSVLAVHIAVVFGPLGWGALRSLWTPPKPIAFRVKLGGEEPSHAPEVGPPSRKRPTPDPGDAPKQEAVKPDPPKPEPPKPQPQPKKEEPKPQPKKEKPQPKKDPVKPKKPDPKKKADPKKEAKVDSRKNQTKTSPKKKQEEVFHDNSWDKFNPASGGTNTNIAVPLGDRDRGQALGKVDNRTPAGGASKEEREYDEKFRKYLYDRWTPPAGVFITAETAVSIYLKYDASGRVLDKRIHKRSPNPELNANAERLLAALDRVPVPPHADELIITLCPENQ